MENGVVRLVAFSKNLFDEIHWSRVEMQKAIDNLKQRTSHLGFLGIVEKYMPEQGGVASLHNAIGFVYDLELEPDGDVVAEVKWLDGKDPKMELLYPKIERLYMVMFGNIERGGLRTNISITNFSASDLREGLIHIPYIPEAIENTQYGYKQRHSP